MMKLLVLSTLGFSLFITACGSGSSSDPAAHFDQSPTMHGTLGYSESKHVASLIRSGTLLSLFNPRIDIAAEIPQKDKTTAFASRTDVFKNNEEGQCKIKLISGSKKDGDLDGRPSKAEVQRLCKKGDQEAEVTQVFSDSDDSDPLSGFSETWKVSAGGTIQTKKSKLTGTFNILGIKSSQVSRNSDGYRIKSWEALDMAGTLSRASGPETRSELVQMSLDATLVPDSMVDPHESGKISTLRGYILQKTKDHDFAFEISAKDMKYDATHSSGFFTAHGYQGVVTVEDTHGNTLEMTRTYDGEGWKYKWNDSPISLR